MSSSVVYEQSPPVAAARLADYLELTKPRIAVLELIVVAVAAFVASWGAPDALVLLHALLGTALVAASASAWNQWIEAGSDVLMDRTANRPLPAGRLSRGRVAMLGTVAGVLGLMQLALAVNLLTALLGLLTWVLYVAVYTPLKSRTPLNTVVGAVAGAMPVLMGWAAVEGQFGRGAAALFLIVFLWQFPHFMAIAWMYRHQYARAGLKMLPVVDPSGRRAAVQAVLSASALLPVTLLMGVENFAGLGYFAWAWVLGCAQLACAVWFAMRLNESSARLLLRASLIYLPSLLAVLVLGPFA